VGLVIGLMIAAVVFMGGYTVLGGLVLVFGGYQSP
jgi:hypothetical protein